MSDNPWNQIPFDQLPPDIQRSIITRRTAMQAAAETQRRMGDEQNQHLFETINALRDTAPDERHFIAAAGALNNIYIAFARELQEIHAPLEIIIRRHFGIMMQRQVELMQQAQREADAAVAALPPMNSEGGHGHE